MIIIQKGGEKMISEETRRKLSLSHLGHKLSEETKIKIGKANSISHKGMIPKNINELPYYPNNPRNKGTKRTEEWKKNHSKLIKNNLPSTIFKKGIIWSEEQIKKHLRRNPKSSLEIKFENIINSLGLPYKFVGNGEVMIAKKCPDFVDKNGKKIAIEVFYRKHKQMFKGNIEVWKAERAKIFNEQGWEIIFFDETQVNEECVKNTLKGGKNCRYIQRANN